MALLEITLKTSSHYITVESLQCVAVNELHIDNYYKNCLVLLKIKSSLQLLQDKLLLTILKKDNYKIQNATFF